MSSSEELFSLSWDTMSKATSLADSIDVFQSPARSENRCQSWSNWESQAPRWVLNHSFEVALADAQAGEGLFFALSVFPSAQMGQTSEASAESSMPEEGHAECHRQGPQQKRKRTSDLQDKGTHLLEGQTGQHIW